MEAGEEPFSKKTSSNSGALLRVYCRCHAAGRIGGDFEADQNSTRKEQVLYCAAAESYEYCSSSLQASSSSNKARAGEGLRGLVMTRHHSDYPGYPVRVKGRRGLCARPAALLAGAAWASDNP